ncbi:MAG: hypothetical protein HRT61_01185 [Ekhidna sp.]|nr:hypothetical protein [Ekhidna sp.]
MGRKLTKAQRNYTKKPYQVKRTGPSKLSNLPPYKHPAFLRALQDAENGSKTGYDPQNGWFPHRSLEGGTDTIGYGHKLSPSEDARDYVMISGEEVPFDEQNRIGIPDELIHQLFREDVERSMVTARNQWNVFYSADIYFDGLASKYQCILTDLVFNIGTLVNRNEWQWPSLAQGIINQDGSIVRKESLRWYTNEQGRKIPLDNRRDLICNAVGIYE